MADCQLLGGCLFYNDKMPIDSGLGSIYKTKYCTGNNNQCARYMVASAVGREKVPTTLYPNQADKAEDIIKQG